MRRHYTEGQRAVLCIVGGEIRRHGVCDLPIDKIAALAGVCRTTVQTTLHEARRLGHIRITERSRPGRKHLPNLVVVTCLEWRAWLRRGSRPTTSPIGSNSPVLVSTTKRLSSSLPVAKGRTIDDKTADLKRAAAYKAPADNEAGLSGENL
jgi:hypothetical protein